MTIYILFLLSIYNIWINIVKSVSLKENILICYQTSINYHIILNIKKNITTLKIKL